MPQSRSDRPATSEAFVSAALSQESETLARAETTPFAVLTYAYQRSRDLITSVGVGQDFLAFRYNSRRIAFALCDGVSQSFLGDVAARILGIHLLQWFWSEAPQLPANQDLETALRQSLELLVPPATQLVTNIRLPVDSPPLVQTALERKREYGSESNFVAGFVSYDEQLMLVNWLGDARFCSWQSGEFHAPSDNLFATHNRWSTQRGVRGDIRTERFHFGNGTQFAVFSDGLALPSFDALNRLPADQLNSVLNDLLKTPKSDDISLLRIDYSAGRGPIQQIPPPRIVNRTDEEIRWQPVSSAEWYRLEAAKSWALDQPLVFEIPASTTHFFLPYQWSRYGWRLRAFASGNLASKAAVLNPFREPDPIPDQSVFDEEPRFPEPRSVSISTISDSRSEGPYVEPQPEKGQPQPAPNGRRIELYAVMLFIAGLALAIGIFAGRNLAPPPDVSVNVPTDLPDIPSSATLQAGAVVPPDSTEDEMVTDVVQETQVSLVSETEMPVESASNTAPSAIQGLEGTTAVMTAAIAQEAVDALPSTMPSQPAITPSPLGVLNAIDNVIATGVSNLEATATMRYITLVYSSTEAASSTITPVFPVTDTQPAVSPGTTSSSLPTEAMPPESEPPLTVESPLDDINLSPSIHTVLPDLVALLSPFQSLLASVGTHLRLHVQAPPTEELFQSTKNPTETPRPTEESVDRTHIYPDCREFTAENRCSLPGIPFWLHCVRSGENLSRIADDYGLEYGVIAQVNNLPNADRVYQGQALLIPQTAEPQRQTITPAYEQTCLTS